MFRLESMLHEKRLAIRSSSRAFDRGELWEAKRIASEIWMLCHDGRGKTKSLLGQLGIRSKLNFFSTGRRSPLYNNPLAYPPTTLVAFEGNITGWAVIPACQLGGFPACRPGWDSWQKFHDWWDEPIIRRANGGSLSRKNLISSARDQDGGAHVDGELTDENYTSLIADLDPSLRHGDVPFRNAHLACIRQIGWEMEASLSAMLGELPE